MKKLNFVGILLSLMTLISCESKPQAEQVETVTTDSAITRQSVSKDSLMAVKHKSTLFRFDRSPKYSIDYDSLLNKRLLLNHIYVRDIFRDSTGIYAKFTSTETVLGGFALTLAIAKKQVDSLKFKEAERYAIVFKLNQARKVTNDTSYYINGTYKSEFLFNGSLVSLVRN